MPHRRFLALAPIEEVDGLPDEGWIVTPSSVLEAVQSNGLADVKLTVQWVDDPNRLPLQLTEDEPLHW